MTKGFLICLPAVLVGVAACTDYTPRDIADAKSITVEDAYKSIGRSFLAIQDVMGDRKMGMITCKVDIKFVIAAQANQNNDLNGGISGGPSYVQAKLSNDYSTSATANRSNTVEIVWGSVYPDVCQPVDATTGSGGTTKNDQTTTKDTNAAQGTRNSSSQGTSVSNSPGSAGSNKKSQKAHSSLDYDRSVASNYGLIDKSPRILNAIALHGTELPELTYPYLGLVNSPNTPSAPTAPVVSKCGPEEFTAHDTTGKIFCIPKDILMETIRRDLLERALKKSP